jgi:hypothetical protein
MAKAGITWEDDGQLHAATVDESSQNYLGRAAGSMVMIQDPTVSRQQAMIGWQDGEFRIENLSTTNPTKLNDQPLAQTAVLKDKDAIAVGGVKLYFHDLTAAATISGPICSYCSRENSAQEKDCWYCGTSLVNAPTTIRERRTVACRLVDAANNRHDLFEGQVLALKEGGSPENAYAERLPPGTALVVEPGAGKATLRVHAGSATVNGQPAADGAEVKTGDVIQVGSNRLVALVA